MTYLDVIASPKTHAANVRLHADIRAGQCDRTDELISVECVAGEDLWRVVPDWLDLLERALDSNVFMDPAFILSAGKSVAQPRLITLLAWRQRGDHRMLVGLWSFAARFPSHSPVRVRVLMAPAYSHAYLAAPVIDSYEPECVLDALLSAIERDARLPKTIVLDCASTDTKTMGALAGVLAARGSESCIANVAQRPILRSSLDGKDYLDKSLSSSTRKKLRQHRRRLEEKGKLEFRVSSERSAVREAFDAFMALERAGWKGRRRTALLDSTEDADSAVAMIADLSERRQAAIHALYLDGSPISMQVVLRAGNAAFTWKTAYDEAFRDYSPGMLLLEEYTREFLADKSIDHVDSCAYDDQGFMSAWTDRQAIAQVWVNARRGRSIAFNAMYRMHFACLDARRRAKQVTASWRGKWMRR